MFIRYHQGIAKFSEMKWIRYSFVLVFICCGQWLKAQENPNDFHLSPLDQIVLTFNFVHPSCPGVCDAAVFLEVDGGQPPYTYSWFNGLTGTEYLNACPGLGSVTVTDALGNTEADSFYVPDPIIPIVWIPNLIITQPTGGQNNGSISVDSSGAIGHPDPLWSLDSIHFNPFYIFKHLGPGIYHLYIGDFNRMYYSCLQ